MRPPICPVCDSPSTRVVGHRHRAPLIECTSCSVVFEGDVAPSTQKPSRRETRGSLVSSFRPTPMGRVAILEGQVSELPARVKDTR